MSQPDHHQFHAEPFSNFRLLRVLFAAVAQIGPASLAHLYRYLNFLRTHPAAMASLRAKSAGVDGAQLDDYGGGGLRELLCSLGGEDARNVTCDPNAFSSASLGKHVSDGEYFCRYAAAAYKRTLPELLEAVGGDMAASDVLHTQLHPQAFVPAHFIVRDRQRKAIVLAIRGTASIRDVVSDMAASPIPFLGGAAHTGMAALVDGLLHYQPPSTGPLASVATPRRHGERQWQQQQQPPTPDNPTPQSEAPVAPFSVPFAEDYERDAVAAAAASGPTPPAVVASGTPAEPRVRAPMHVVVNYLDETPLPLPRVERFGVAGVAALLQRAAWLYPDHRLVIASHSLGAGVAALLTVKLLRTLREVWERAARASARPLGGDGEGESAAAPSSPPAPTAAAHHADADPRAVFNLLLFPPRPIHCYAYAAPACLSPDLAALAGLSVDDVVAASETQLPRPTTDTTAFATAAEQHNKAIHYACATAVAKWPAHLRTQPLITSIVYGDDLVPRLTLVSLAGLYEFLKAAATGSNSGGGPGALISLPPLLGACGGCGPGGGPVGGLAWALKAAAQKARALAVGATGGRGVRAVGNWACRCELYM